VTQLEVGLPEDQSALPAREFDSRAQQTLGDALPSLRAAPGFPGGSASAILAMSEAPTYAACPNPFGHDLVAVDTSPRPDVAPFATDTKVGKGHAIYKAHSYVTKVPHQAIMRFLLHYTEPGDLVLDGFCGSGMTGVAAQACGRPDDDIREAIEAELPNVRWGVRKAFLQDLSPSATFIASGLNQSVDHRSFDRASNALLNRFDRDWGWMYATTDDGGKPAQIDYVVWSEVFSCPHCTAAIVFYDTAFDPKTEGLRESFSCPKCGVALDKAALKRRFKSYTTLAGDRHDRVEYVPVQIFWRVGKRHGRKRPSDADLGVLRRVETQRVSGFPTNELPLAGMLYDRPHLGPKGFTQVHHLWGDRALIAMTSLWSYAKEEPDLPLRHALLFWIEQALWGTSWMNRYKPIQFGRVGGSAVNNYMSGVYYIPSLHAEPSVRYNLDGHGSSRGKRASLVRLWAESPARDGSIRISTASSTKVDLPDNSVDYVFVDPPFGSNIPYADLAFVIESWHGVFTNVGEEAIVNPSRQSGLPEYTALMEGCFREFFRVLKPGRWMTVEFSNSSNAVWLGIQQALTSSGFVIADTRILDKTQLSHFQVTAINVVKRDLIISAYKPRSEVAERIRLSAGSEDGVWEFVREHLRHVEVTPSDVAFGIVRERQVDRLFDRMVAYHVANGIAVPMSLSEFTSGIDQRFNRADGMSFLPNQEEEYQRWRLTVPRPTQEGAFITNEGSAVAWIRRLVEASGRLTFPEIQPAFFKEVQTGLADYEEMPDLRVILAENFLQDDRGRWFIPDQSDAAQMERLHNQALLRVFADYAATRGSLGSVRSEAIRVGFTNAWNERDFEPIYAVGRRLPADFWVTETALHHFYRAAERQVAKP
jgi:hypothetical protein